MQSPFFLLNNNMAFDIRYLIEREITTFKDRYVKKRGPRHLRDGAGLNLDRKHQNIIADVHKSDPNQINSLEKLRKLKTGKGFVNFIEGEKLKQKYGLKTDTGYLGTTGIKMVKTVNGYRLIKEAVFSIDGVKYNVKSPDKVWSDVPGTHVTFFMIDGVFFYKTGVGDSHADLDTAIRKNFPSNKYSVFPNISRGTYNKIRGKLEKNLEKWRSTATRYDIKGWGDLYGNPRGQYNLAGRLVLQHDFVTFWNTMKDVRRYKNVLKAFFKHINFTQDPIIITSDVKEGKFSDKTDLKSKIDTELLKSKHLSPQIKKAADPIYGSEALQKKSKEAGYTTPAEFKHSKVIGDSVMNESPENIVGNFSRYRNQTSCYLFIGNVGGTGLIYCKASDHISHSELYRAYKRNTSSRIRTIGFITTEDAFDLRLSGVVLVKGYKIPATYVSCWTEDSRELKPFLDELIHEVKAEAPYYYEFSDIDDPGREKVEPYIL